MSYFDTAYSIATENHGILTAYEARRNGIASKDVARWVRIGRFVKLGNGVYKSTQYPSSEEDAYAVAVAQCGRGAYLCGESVLGFLRLMPTCVDRIHVMIPRRVRRRLPEGYVVGRGAAGYVPVSVNGVMCQRPMDALRQCVETHMNDRLLQAARSAFENGHLSRQELQQFERDLADGQ